MVFCIAAVINGVFRLADIAGKQTFPLKSDQVVKFSNYLISRKTVSTPRGLWLLVSALDIVAGNKVRRDFKIICTKLNNPHLYCCQSLVFVLLMVMRMGKIIIKGDFELN